MMKHCLLTVFVFLYLPSPTPAPVPRCSPFIIINKLAEFNNLMSDSNPYFPLPPCEYGSWQNALAKGDWESVFVLAQPQKIPLHNFYEFIWFLKTGLPRVARMLLGKEKFKTDDNILNEGYQQAGSYVRTRQFGQNTVRRPEIIDNKKTYKAVVGGKIKELLTRGPDKRPRPYTPQGPLPGRRSLALPIQRSRVISRRPVSAPEARSQWTPVHVSSPHYYKHH